MPVGANNNICRERTVTVAACSARQSMMETALSKEEKMLASSSWRRANAHNSREEQNLQKEKRRLSRQFEAEACQLKAAQNRFEQQYKTARKTSLVLPPVHEELSNARLELSKRSAEEKVSKSLPSLPRLADSVFTVRDSDTRTRSTSVISATDVAEQTDKKYRRRTKSYAGLSNLTRMSSDQFQPR